MWSKFPGFIAETLFEFFKYLAAVSQMAEASFITDKGWRIAPRMSSVRINEIPSMCRGGTLFEVII